jgi:hypothetical protein
MKVAKDKSLISFNRNSHAKMAPDSRASDNCLARQGDVSLQLVEQRLCVFEDRRVEPFGEPAVGREEIASLDAFALVTPQAGKTGGRAQFPTFGALPLCDVFQLCAGDHCVLRNRTILFANVCCASYGLLRQHELTRVRKPQNFVEFCGSEPITFTRLPRYVVDQAFELLKVAGHDSIF